MFVSSLRRVLAAETGTTMIPYLYVAERAPLVLSKPTGDYAVLLSFQFIFDKIS